MRSFRSDNNAGLCPEAVQAIIDANDGSHLLGYGDDEITGQAEQVFRDLLHPEAAVYFVTTGTAANILAIAALTEPWQQVICHGHSHFNENESTAPERVTHCRTTAVRTESSKLTPEDIRQAAMTSRGDVHQPQPGVVTISNPSEFITVYTPDEMKAICDVAHEAGFRVHVDGARFANAVASLGCDPRDLTTRAGVDGLSFGGTKNGLACSEAIVLLPQGDGRAFQRARETIEYHRKATGHLLSKLRFIAGPFAVTLRDGVWLRHAAHANAMAARLGGGLEAAGITPVFPVQANGVFAQLPPAVDEALQAAGQGYYTEGGPDNPLSRFMCSFDTQIEDVDAFLDDLQAALTR